MEIYISVDVQPLEAYNIFIDGENAIKVRGNKTTRIKLSFEEHTLQIKSLGGRSNIIKINKSAENEIMNLKFITNWLYPFKEGYFEFEEDKNNG